LKGHQDDTTNHEWTKHESFDNLEDVRWSVFKYIETFYNRERIHQTLGYKTPDQFEAEYKAQGASAALSAL